MTDYTDLIARLERDKWHISGVDAQRAADAIAALVDERDRMLQKYILSPAQQADPMACRKCGGAMAPGIAMGQTVDRSDEGTCSPAGPGRIIGCMKCTACGWSVAAGVLAGIQQAPL